MFGRKKKNVSDSVAFDSKKQKAVLHCSICTGEQVAGFKDIETGKFDEVTLIRNAQDLEEFKKQYHITEIIKEY